MQGNCVSSEKGQAGIYPAGESNVDTRVEPLDSVRLCRHIDNPCGETLRTCLKMFSNNWTAIHSLPGDLQEGSRAKECQV